MKIKLLVIILVLFASSATAALRDLGRVTSVAKSKTNGVVLATSSGARVLVEFTTPDVIRFRLAPTGVFERDFSYALDPARSTESISVSLTQTAAELTLSAPNASKIIIAKTDCSFRILDESGKTVLYSDVIHPISFDVVTGEIQATIVRPSEVETYYGFGEKAFPDMSRNGKFIVNWNTDTFSYPIGTDPVYESIPFFTALYEGRAYGLFFNNTFRTWFDMGAKDPRRYSFGADGGELDFYIFTGGRERSPKNVTKAYAELTGKTPLPPIWALGNQQSRWSYFPESRVREIADGFRKNRIPADVIYLDIDYMDGYRVFTWDKKRFPDPPGLISDLKKQGFQTVLIVDPGIKVDENYDVYRQGKQAGIYVKNPDGTELHRDVWPKAAAFPDFTDIKAREWFGSLYKRHIDEGVAGFWNDMNEPGVFVTDKTERPEITHHPEKTFPYETPHKGDGLPDTHRRYHNVFGMQMARATFEGVKKLAPDKRPFVLTRAGFAGVQRFSAVWTGDNYASWDHLALSIPMLANLSISGVPFVGCDVGGFNDRPTGELYTRWLQAAALTPFFRSHSVGWSGNKEPWEYGEEFTKINRATVELRYQFLPYLYTLFREHERLGEPVMRPLWYQYPADKKTYLISDEFMVGSDILVAPIVKEGLTSRRVYLPAGANWINWWTSEFLEGGKEHIVDAPLERLLIFQRAGSVVPTQRGFIQNTGEMPGIPLVWNVGAGVSSNKVETGFLYEDAGESLNYRNATRNEWKETRVEYRDGSLKFTRTGNFNGQKAPNLLIRGLATPPKSAEGDGQELPVKFFPMSKYVWIDIPDHVAEIRISR